MTNAKTPCWGVYRVKRSGEHVYVSRSATHCENLAKAIAADLTRGEITMPDGSTKYVQARPHIAKLIA